MCSRTTSTSLYACLLLGAAFAGSSQDPAFFMRSDWDYQGIYHNPSTNLSAWNAQTYWGWQQGDLSRGWIGVSGSSAEFQNSSLEVKESARPNFFSYFEFNGFGIFASVDGENAQKWGAGYGKKWYSISGEVRASFAKKNSPKWVLQNSHFPEETPELDGEWRHRQQSLFGVLRIQRDHWGLSGSVSGVRSTPSQSKHPYCLIDSSLWISGSLESFLDLGPFALSGKLQSTSGNVRMQGLRQDSSYSRLVAVTSSGWDVNKIQIRIASQGFREPSNPDPQWKQLDGPLDIPFSYLDPNPRALSGQLRYHTIHGEIFKPSGSVYGESLWGNRLFSPGLEDIYGFSFYRENFAGWGSGSLESWQFELNAPYRGKMWQPWASVGFNYLHLQGTSTFRKRTVVFIAEEQESYRDKWDMASFIGLAGIGTRWEVSPKLPISVSLALQQVLPLSIIARKNGEKIFPQKQNASGNGYDPLQDGFRANLSLEWNLN